MFAQTRASLELVYTARCACDTRPVRSLQCSQGSQDHMGVSRITAALVGVRVTFVFAGNSSTCPIHRDGEKAVGAYRKTAFLRVSATLEGDIMEFAGNREVLVGDSPALEGNSAVLSRSRAGSFVSHAKLPMACVSCYCTYHCMLKSQASAGACCVIYTIVVTCDRSAAALRCAVQTMVTLEPSRCRSNAQSRDTHFCSCSSSTPDRLCSCIQCTQCAQGITVI